MTAGGPRLEIWLADLKQLEPALNAAERRHAVLASSERAWSNTPGPAVEARRLSRIALRLLLARWNRDVACGVEFATGPHGKPLLTGGTAHFSLSHTRDHALFAISAASPVGVDLEADRTIQLGTARLALMIAAADALAGAHSGHAAPDTVERSVQAWTVLEAFAKARGSGIGALLTELGITAAGLRAGSPVEIAARAADLLDTTRFRVHRLTLPTGWHGAVASAGDITSSESTPRMMLAEHCVFAP